MDIKTLKEITKLMKENDLVEVEVEAPDLKIKLKKASPASHYVTASAPPPMPVIASLPAAASAAAPSAAAPAADENANYKPIISPIPGTVYLKPNPETPLFVSVGTPIDETKVVCLIEAMKVFNEIKPDPGMKGTIKKILVSDGQAVEYGTVLFLVG
jgi:acetyl-CoA carboxylase biotin carboxyl carrier protein